VGHTPPVDLEEARRRVRDFAERRDWSQFHSPKNLAMALGGGPSHGILSGGSRFLPKVEGTSGPSGHDAASSWEVHVCHVPEEMDTIRLHTRA
jgi:hypothetical protein